MAILGPVLVLGLLILLGWVICRHPTDQPPINLGRARPQAGPYAHRRYAPERCAHHARPQRSTVSTVPARRNMAVPDYPSNIVAASGSLQQRAHAAAAEAVQVKVAQWVETHPGATTVYDPATHRDM